MTNPLKNTRIEFHILQSFPVTCLNRDDVGAPKTAMVGGVPRARVSSQAWKRPVRLAMQEYGAKLGVRTKHIAELIAQECIIKGADEEQAKVCGEAIASHISKDTLLFFTKTEAQAFADYAAEKEFDASKLKDKETYKVGKKALNLAFDGVDIALFGRMVAQAAELNVEAACSFAHAISTHKVANEVEFFTAVDDDPMGMREDSGSAHMGSLEYNSATYYRYVSLDLGQLYQTLNGQNMAGAIESFVKALYVAVPAARQTTMTGLSAWDYAKVLVRKGQSLQASFDNPVKAKSDGYLVPSIEALNTDLAKKEQMAGSLFGKQVEIELPPSNIDELIVQLQKFLPDSAE
ncbi:MAG: type I-E CRISPR-associated protein Cas7/Cse4/CasC [Thiomicrorhabdus chilensis]|uniref:type I-E CRISPR-associated protein Cas7/Cse4/CasC n=1 Tax=Thiomicrorhabdus chilensis TaxID=63656 RepID=UPI00299EDAE4|nr:type I-E CRISPR-associated protein Cas7/Cse4/CasC [Thiomicrorhabdus chilensis]MDX1348096.1 type I-E CRISPR-associated protein Cas7/Cse4/CasC [Thiomicrorhabdus chilensis]